MEETTHRGNNDSPRKSVDSSGESIDHQTKTHQEKALTRKKSSRESIDYHPRNLTVDTKFEPLIAFWLRLVHFFLCVVMENIRPFLRVELKTPQLSHVESKRLTVIWLSCK
ncbi:hypothetical protein CDAR_273621 [Caerostris darwini]|uniref:Uncharacterized protein n=1 Tax=Caerostris darwini TaxID=1538125 RepID=A0AAV4SA03_9ARAC|nr:hypothetical protein CDAR_273621 [Caerostris darwini]